MCLAIPARVIAVSGEDQARIDIVGVQKDISTALMENVVVGDYLIVHVGHAIGRIDADEAEKTLAILAEMSDEDAKVLAAAAM